MGCEVCCGYAGGLPRNPQGCPCCSPEPEESETTCEGGIDGCWGCGMCEDSTCRVRRVIARAPRSEAGHRRRDRNGIRPGDEIIVERGFTFQRNGPRLRYYITERKAH